MAHLADRRERMLACCPPGRREALSDVFDMMDVDGNGLLSLEEYNFLELRTSGEKCDEEAWLVCKGHDFSLTDTGSVYLRRLGILFKAAFVLLFLLGGSRKL